MSELFHETTNCSRLRLQDVPCPDFGAFRKAVIGKIEDGARVSAFFAFPENQKLDKMKLIAVLTHGVSGKILILSTYVSKSFESLTPVCPQFHLFEREIAEQWGIVPEGHPWLKPVRFHKSHSGSDAWNRTAEILPSVTDFYKVEGEEIHEVAVGPVHAGVIEPGHFRFQCHGENVFNLEISLGYQHRGIEKRLLGGPDKKTVHYMETLSGDTSIGHTLAYAQAIEALSGFSVSAKALSIRGIALELERMANHTGDLGALANDVAFLPTASYCGRLRGDYLNMTAAICGNRFGRNLVVPGGTAVDIEEDPARKLHDWLRKVYNETENAIKLLWSTPSVISRFENTGTVSMETAFDLGLVGVAARACGIEQDVRYEFPSGIYRFVHIPPCSYPSGDVLSRAYVRWFEISRSADFISDQLKSLPSGDISSEPGDLAADSISVSLIEGWRGEICHVAVTGHDSRFQAYKIVDPSFHNWQGLAMSLRNEQISNFPLCNKSFNLSYCGYDL